MKYNITIKNAKVQNVAEIEELNVQVEYSVGEIPEILGHVLPFIERVAGEIVPKIMDKVVETKAKVHAFEAEGAARRKAAQEQAERELEAHWSGGNIRQRAAKTHTDAFEEAFRQTMGDLQAMQEQLDKAQAPKEPDTIGESLGAILRRRLQSQIDNDRAHHAIDQRWMGSGE